LDELLAQEPIENGVTVVTNLHLFLENCLIPSAVRAQSKAELKALVPVMQKCFTLGERLSVIDPEDKLLRLKDEAIQKYNSKTIIFDPRYQKLIGYEKGSVENLESEEARTELVRNLTGFFANFPRSNITEVVPKSEQAALYDAILTLQDEFEEHGDGARLEPIRNQLGQAVGSVDGIRSGFPVELRQLAEGEIKGPHKPILKKLVAFEKNVLTPALAQGSTSEELRRLEPLVDQCIALKSEIERADAKGKLKASHQDLINQWNAKNYQTSRIHHFLVSYERGNLSGIDQEAKREHVALSIQTHIDRVVQNSVTRRLQLQKKGIYIRLFLLFKVSLKNMEMGKDLNLRLRNLERLLGFPMELEMLSPLNLRSLTRQLSNRLKRRFS